MYEQINCRKCSSSQILVSADLMPKAPDTAFMNLVSIKQDGSACIGLYRCPRCGHEERVGELSNTGNWITARCLTEEFTAASEAGDKERIVSVLTKNVKCEYCNHVIRADKAVEQVSGHVVLACPNCKQPWGVPSLSIRKTGCVVGLLVIGAFFMAIMIGVISLLKLFLAH